MNEYASLRADWPVCKYCGEREASEASLREHMLSCTHPKRDPTVEGAHKDGDFVKRILGSAGPPEHRYYLVDWCHPEDPSPGSMPGDEDYVQWTHDPEQHGPGYTPT